MYKRQADKSAIDSYLGINEYFVKDYLLAKNNYPIMKVIQIIALLREYDLKSKGIGGECSELDLFKELAFKIMH